jgi:hypothetical protein
MSHDWSEIATESDYYYADYSEPHTLLVHDVQEMYVYTFVNQISFPYVM